MNKLKLNEFVNHISLVRAAKDPFLSFAPGIWVKTTLNEILAYLN